jgi:hypothetical protein
MASLYHVGDRAVSIEEELGEKKRIRKGKRENP